jgi:rfaE bifunctional protein kinase chain/domain
MTAEQLLAAFNKITALVVGDICLDRWCSYDPAAAEPSCETGLPRIGVVSTEVTPGAGGTVASNLIALNASRVAVLGVCGDDGHGMELLRALEARDVSTELMVKSPHVPTFTYTKLINARNGVEDLPRLDFIYTQPIPAEAERKVTTRLESVVGGYDVILVADQAETDYGGVITPAVRRVLRDAAVRYPEKVFWVDSRKRIDQFRRMILKPNREEAESACQRLFNWVDYQKFLRHTESKLLMVTHGRDGVLVIERDRENWVETVPVDKPVDICGAGDSFSAGASLALAVTESPIEAARFGNLVASITIMKKGTGTASPQEILAAEARIPR